MNKLKRLISHVKNGTIIERIKNNRYVKKDKEWQAFLKSSREYIDTQLTSDVKIRLYKNSHLSKSIYCYDFEYDELAFVKRFLKNEDIFFDIGANVGIFSLCASPLVGDGGKIFSFEPAEQTFNKLTENIDINKLKNVFANKLGFSDKTGIKKFNISLEGFDAFNSFGQPSKGKDFLCQDVVTETIDNFINVNQLKNRVALMKIDVEGWEIPVLDGAIKTLKENDAPVLMVEFAEKNIQIGFTCQKLYDLIKSYGYELYRYNARSNTLLIENSGEKYYPYVNLIACKNLESVCMRIK